MVERYTMIERLVAGETCPERHSERTTGFEPATLTLARMWYFHYQVLRDLRDSLLFIVFPAQAADQGASTTGFSAI